MRQLTAAAYATLLLCGCDVRESASDVSSADLAYENAAGENLWVENLGGPKGAVASDFDANMVTDEPAASPGAPDTNTVNLQRPKKPGPRR